MQNFIYMHNIEPENKKMPNINVTIRMDKDLKIKSDDLFKDLGMSFTTAVTVFVKQALRERKIPFEISSSNKIDFASDKEIDDISSKLISKNKEAYLELAK